MHGLKTSSLLRSKVKTTGENEYLRRFQLLQYRDVTRLCDIMETPVPIHGAGNFPTLQIKPSLLVQLVRKRLESIGVTVRDIRLNGSAATHVLSGDMTHAYQDLDLIFTIDFPSLVQSTSALPETNRDWNGSYDKCLDASALQLGDERTEIESLVKTRPTSLLKEARRQASPVPEKDDFNDDLFAVDDSGYTSSGSSATSAPVSPSCSLPPLSFDKGKKKMFRSRTRSFESVSSTSSIPPFPAFKPLLENSAEPTLQTFFRHHQSWQDVKDATMEVLLDFLPEGVNRSRMDSAVLRSAYVQKMVKVINASDEWSLISLNNNSGRNLELKFVQSMKRQYEFSVDSFQIILDTYLGFCAAAAEAEGHLCMSEAFHPTVLAESVYGDCAKALRHLRDRRICTRRPEEIRGGGLLRYCNLLVRDFSPGDCAEVNEGASSSAAKTNLTSSDHCEVAKLEQHMCSRFFIDFNDIDRQRRKLVSYLDNHFAGEDDLKFQYLLVLRRVVDTSTVCLMSYERTMILNLITMLVRQTLAHNVSAKSADVLGKRFLAHADFSLANCGECLNHFNGTCYNTIYQPPSLSSGCSSPMSSYSSYNTLIEGESTPICMISRSRPETPAEVGAYCTPSQCNSQTHHPQDCYYGELSPCGELVANCACPGGWSYCGHQVEQVCNSCSVESPWTLPEDQYAVNMIQPIACDFSKIKCYYTPAGYNEQPGG